MAALQTMPNVCPKCEIGLTPKEEDQKYFVVCPVCGYRREITEVTEHTCSACGNEKATLLYFGIIVGDEAALCMYKCLKCGHVDREGYS